MAARKLKVKLNSNQLIAATTRKSHALVLAGAGTGKTKTIVARASFLISQGAPAEKVRILTFTKRAASEIVERVQSYIGNDANALKASTFHSWCISLVRKAPNLFGCKNFTIIDRDDQLLLFKFARGSLNKNDIPLARKLCDLYSLSRNTRESLADIVEQQEPQYLSQFDNIAQIMLDYESKKQERNYLDYDDIIALVADQLSQSKHCREWVSEQVDHLLIDEMQDTNPLQWSLIEPLINSTSLFCVGDDAQSIYGFRGADFKNIHSFKDRVPGAEVYKLLENYRSTQEILDVSNWLLAQSSLNYDKRLISYRGKGVKPKLFSFMNKWEEGRWIVDDIVNRHKQGASWKQHMVLVRSGYVGRTVEASLLEKGIPYQFIGGIKLLESAHIKDLLSLLRVAANRNDEIAWMRFLTLWTGIGDVTASELVREVFEQVSHKEIAKLLDEHTKVPQEAVKGFRDLIQTSGTVADSISLAYRNLEKQLAQKYSKKDWDNRKKDIAVVKQLAKRHTSTSEFIDEYLLDPLHISQVNKTEVEDAVTVITIHSAKGAECEVCYVMNVSPGAFPGPFSIGSVEDVEEERRVLYVALTRAKNELIMTRLFGNTVTFSDSPDDAKPNTETYFLNSLPSSLVEEKSLGKTSHTDPATALESDGPHRTRGIDIGTLKSSGAFTTEASNKSPSANLPIQRNLSKETDLGVKIVVTDFQILGDKKFRLEGELKSISGEPINETRSIDISIINCRGYHISVSYFSWFHLETQKKFVFDDDLLNPISSLQGIYLDVSS